MDYIEYLYHIKVVRAKQLLMVDESYDYAVL